MSYNKITMSREQLLEIYARYENNERLEDIAREIPIATSTLRAKLADANMPLRKHKKYSGKVTPENIRDPFAVGKDDKPNPRYCGSCQRGVSGAESNVYCYGGTINGKDFDLCYGTRDKPNFKRYIRFN